MNQFLKGQIFNEIRKPNNKIKRYEQPDGEEMIVTSSFGRVLIDVMKSGDKRIIKVGGQEVVADDKDFEEIMLELHICYASEMKQNDFDDGKPKISGSVFSAFAKEK